jgi:anti-sigma B factor antagonist
MTVTSLGEHLLKIGFSGRLDSPGVDKVETQFMAHLMPTGKNAVIDLSAVDFISSLGIRMFVIAAKGARARQAKLALFGVQPQVMRILEAVALQQLMPVCPTEAEALEAVATA